MQDIIYFDGNILKTISSISIPLWLHVILSLLSVFMFQFALFNIYKKIISEKNKNDIKGFKSFYWKASLGHTVSIAVFLYFLFDDFTRAEFLLLIIYSLSFIFFLLIIVAMIRR